MASASAANKILVDFKQNHALRDALGGKQVGEKCTLKIKLQVDRISEEGFEGSIEEITPEGYKPPPTMQNDGSGKIKPEADSEPVMVMVRGKQAKGY